MEHKVSIKLTETPPYTVKSPVQRSLWAVSLTKSPKLILELQPEYVCVPIADDGLIKIETKSSHDDLNYLFLSDILATGWQCLDFSGFQAGDSVAVFGGGPVDHVPARPISWG
ncbi:zinc-binding dehydrogenase family oxidoreductase [Apiospora phragmitis]|uniref:Zinc-binding dehydrogenase family oxidoreductase n=1 Tax=Apiospora phragmitis TaxID=2905665 RepID=A0ABR1WR80_9PEZI